MTILRGHNFSRVTGICYHCRCNDKERVTTDCPGYALIDDMLEKIRAGSVDYVEGVFIRNTTKD